MDIISTRAGRVIRQSENYNAFIPNPLPPNPPISFDAELLKALSDADRALGKLNGISILLPDPALFVAMYVKKEALLSSQIEGTQASLIDILDETSEKTNDVREVVRYISAMDYGLERLKDFPLSLRLIREIHEKLLAGTRGDERNPGEFRRSQNWIGPQGSTLKNATFVPPPVHEMEAAIGDFERYMMDPSDIMPPLVKVSLLHAQFETIHPFLDGNGRMGRLLITFWLCQQGILQQPLLYLSYYFKSRRTQYYDMLMDVRVKGDWEHWVKFFLEGVCQVATEAVATAHKIVKLKSEMEASIRARGIATPKALTLLEHIFSNPIITVNEAVDLLDVAFSTANNLIAAFEDIGILFSQQSARRNRKFVFADYLIILQEGTEPVN